MSVAIPGNIWCSGGGQRRLAHRTFGAGKDAGRTHADVPAPAQLPPHPNGDLSRSEGQQRIVFVGCGVAGVAAQKAPSSPAPAASRRADEWRWPQAKQTLVGAEYVPDGAPSHVPLATHTVCVTLPPPHARRIDPPLDTGRQSPSAIVDASYMSLHSAALVLLSELS